MAPKPKSHSAKPASSSKAKSTSSATKIKQELLKGRKPALRMKENHNKIKQKLLKDRKLEPAASSSAKEDHKKIKQELLKGRKPAVSSSGKENHETQLKKLKAENDVLRKTLAVKDRVQVTTIIPRPEKGVAGSGFNLQEAMGLADDTETYALLRRSVRDLAGKAGLDCAVLWHRQPKDLISKIIGAARERHNYFKKFPHGWAIEEFLKSNLKNKRAYARKRGYLGDRTNQGVGSGEGSKLGDGDEGASEGGDSDGAGINQDRDRHSDNEANDSDDSEGDESNDDEQGGSNDDSDGAGDDASEGIYMDEDEVELEYTGGED